LIDVTWQLLAFSIAPVLEASKGTIAGNFGRWLVKYFRFVRVFKILRTIRLLRYNAEAHLIIMTLSASLTSCCLDACCTVSASTLQTFVHGKRDSQQLQAGRDNSALLRIVGDASLSPFESIAGGISWDEITRPTIELSPGMASVFCAFIAFCQYAVLNIVTSQFVNCSMSFAEKLKKDTLIKKMYAVIDTDRTGYIDRAEYDACLKTELMRQTFQYLSLDMHYASRLFDIIDTSDDGQVDVEEFIDSMARLTRPARLLGFRQSSAAWLKLRG